MDLLNQIRWEEFNWQEVQLFLNALEPKAIYVFLLLIILAALLIHRQAQEVFDRKINFFGRLIPQAEHYKEFLIRNPPLGSDRFTELLLESEISLGSNTEQDKGVKQLLKAMTEWSVGAKKIIELQEETQYVLMARLSGHLTDPETAAFLKFKDDLLLKIRNQTMTELVFNETLTTEKKRILEIIGKRKHEKSKMDL